MSAAIVAVLLPGPRATSGGALDPWRALGGGACLVAVVVAAVTARAAMHTPERWRFISEVLAAYRRTTDLPSRAGAIGSLIANAFMAIGAALFAAGAVNADATTAPPMAASGVLLMAVVGFRLADHPRPRSRKLLDYAHPAAAAGFYLASVTLSWAMASRLGPLAWWFAAIHLVAAQGLILMSIAGSFLSYRPEEALWPLGLRILLDLEPGSYAGCVRGFQWPATFATGLALCASAVGW